MPGPWTLPPNYADLARLHSQAPQRQEAQIDPELKVRYDRAIATAEQVLTFEGNVEAIYGVTTVKANRLVLYMAETDRRGIAEGKVELIDPEGNVKAERLEFDWRKNTAKASVVNVMVADLQLDAESADIQPGTWTFLGVRLVPCEEEPAITLRLGSLTVKPGKEALAHKVRLLNGERSILSLPRYSISLDRRSQGITWPKLSYRGGQFGVSWELGMEVAPNTFVDGGFSSYPERRFSSSLMVSQSFLPAGVESGSAVPRSELSEPFAFGFFENINVRSPQAERNWVSANRLSLSAGTAWSQGRYGEGGGAFNKPYELVGEASMPFNGFGIYAQLRGQRVGTQGVGYEERLLGTASMSMPALAIGKNLYTVVRVDARGATSTGNDFGWVRGHAGLVFEPSSKVRLGFAYSDTANFGTPGFSFDVPLVDRSYHGRIDLDLGATKLGFLAKYDASGNLDWYDREFFVSQVMGCIEPYAVWRERPRSFSFGFTFRPIEALQRLQSRTLTRTKSNFPAAPVPPGHGHRSAAFDVEMGY
jgi:hypothetical protein